MLQYALSLEQTSEHPLADAVVAYAKNKQVFAVEITEFMSLPGKGVQ